LPLRTITGLKNADNITAADRYHVSGRQERVASDQPAARFDLAGREKLIRPLAVVE